MAARDSRLSDLLFEGPLLRDSELSGLALHKAHLLEQGPLINVGADRGWVLISRERRRNGGLLGRRPLSIMVTDPYAHIEGSRACACLASLGQR